jgi:DnaJ-class molecular chaperone
MKSNNCPKCLGTGTIYEYISDDEPTIKRQCNICNGQGSIDFSGTKGALNIYKLISDGS